MEIFPDGTLRGSLILLSKLNVQTNQYDQIGKFPIVAMRKNGKSLFLFLNGNKPILGIEINNNLDWTIQNNVYCTFLDPGNNRYLVLFGSPEDALLFTLIALSSKVFSNLNSFIEIISTSTPKFSMESDFKINFILYSLNVSKIENPIQQENNFIVTNSSDPHFLLLKGNCSIGNVFLLPFSSNSIAIVTIVEEILIKKPESNLIDSPQLSEIPKIKEIKNEIIKKDEIKEEIPKNKILEEEINNNNNQKTESKSPFDNQIEEIKKEFNDKFEELSKKIINIKKSQNISNSQSISSDILISSIQRLIKENELKDKLITEKQQLIDSLSSKRLDTRERDSLRKELSEISSKIVNQKNINQQKNKEKEDLIEKINKLKFDIEKFENEKKIKLNNLKKQIEEDQKNQLNEIEQQQQKLNWDIKKSEEETKLLNDQLNKLKLENNELKININNNSKQELEKLKNDLPKITQNIIKKLASNTFSYINDEIDPDEEYEGNKIINAVKIALKTSADQIIEELE